MKRIIGIDPGSEQSGMTILDNDIIIGAYNLQNDLLYSKIAYFLLHNDVTVAVEGLAAYSGHLKPQVITTAYFIGELLYRLRNEAGVRVELIPRSEVKKWVFDKFPHVCVPLINKKIQKKDARYKVSGELMSPSMVWVDDKVVTESMKDLYKIPLPKAGKGYLYGLQSHSWQALAVASCLKYSVNYLG